MDDKPFRVICPQCGARYAVADKTASGRQARCKRCGIAFVVAVIPWGLAPRKDVPASAGELPVIDGPKPPNATGSPATALQQPTIPGEAAQQTEPAGKTAERWKRCPYCAELIRQAAIVCRFCERDLVAEQQQVSREPRAPSPAAIGAPPVAGGIPASHGEGVGDRQQEVAVQSRPKMGAHRPRLVTESRSSSLPIIVGALVLGAAFVGAFVLNQQSPATTKRIASNPLPPTDRVPARAQGLPQEARGEAGLGAPFQDSVRERRTPLSSNSGAIINPATPPAEGRREYVERVQRMPDVTDQPTGARTEEVPNEGIPRQSAQGSNDAPMNIPKSREGRQTPAKHRLVLKPPNGATDSDLSKAAVAMHARCAAYGYEGVVVKTIETTKGRQLILEAAAPIGPEMRAGIETLGRVSGRKLQIRLVRSLNEVEQGQFPTPDRDSHKPWPAPMGTQWLSTMTRDGAVSAEPHPILVRDSPAIDKASMNISVVPKGMSDEPETRMDLSATDVRLFIGPPEPTIAIVLDDLWLDERISLDHTPSQTKTKLVQCPNCASSGEDRRFRFVPWIGGGLYGDPYECRTCQGKGWVKVEKVKSRDKYVLRCFTPLLGIWALKPLPFALTVSDEAPAEPLPSAPAKPAPAPAKVLGDRVQHDCANRLLLAKNFYNVRQMKEAEESAKITVEQCPDSEMAKEAQRLLEKIALFK